MDDVAGSVTATLSGNEDDLPEINAGATNTNEVVVSPGPGSSNQIEDQLEHIDDLGLVGRGAPVRPRVAGGGGGGGVEGQEPHHSEDPGLVGEGALVRPRVAGGGGGGDREGQEDPGYHEDSFKD
jgi:hypothetical protein